MPALTHAFPYDRFQEEAIRAIREGVSVFVSAPTGSGKTVIAEIAVEEALASVGMAIYTAPIKALSNQKYRDFYARYGDKVGILTGDLTLNPNAPLLIMTTEIYRNTLFEGSTRFSQCRWVIFDEVHYLDDKERGTVWEEALLLTPRETEILALSATIPNAKQLASWIERIHGRPVRVVLEEKRSVPQRFYFQCQDELYGDLENTRARGYAGMEQVGGGQRAFRMAKHRGGKHYFRHRPGGYAPPRERHGRPNRADHLLKKIHGAGHLPCIWFAFSRKRVEDLAWEFAALGLADAQTKQKLTGDFDELARRFEITHEPSVASMREVVAQGVAFHHAGLLPTLKEVVERLFTSRLLPVIVTTETFALGVNMPARAVVLDTLARRAAGPREVLRVRELSQMAGRAGRRGMDETGFVYLRVNPWEVPFGQLSNLLHGKPEEVSSRFSLAYSTILNLYQRYGRDLLPFYQKTLHAFQAPAFRQREAYQLIERRLALLEKLGYLKPVGPEPPARPELAEGHRPSSPVRPEPVEGKRARGQLTPKGEFAASIYGYELLLSAFFAEGWLDSLSLTDLGILLLAVIYEPRRFGGPAQVSRHVGDMAQRAQNVLERIHNEERRARISPLTKPAAFHLSAGMEKWLGGTDFDKLVEITEAAEGELIRYLRMTVQLCRALEQARAASPALKQKAGHLLRLINRDQVDAEAELRRSL